MKLVDEIKQPIFLNGKHKAAVNIMFTANWLTNKMEEVFRPHGITAQQFNILRILKGQLPKTISAKAIKERMLDKNSDVSRLLDRLETKALITKVQNTCDKRSLDIIITDQGITLLTNLSQEQSHLESILNITDESAHALSDLLDQLRT